MNETCKNSSQIKRKNVDAQDNQIKRSKKQHDFTKSLHRRWRPERLQRRWRLLGVNLRQHVWKNLSKLMVMAHKNCLRERNKIAKEQLKQLKQKKREEKRMLTAPSAGTKVKGRDGSTRHGLVISYSSYHRPDLTVREIEHRNSILCVNKNVCFWCKSSPKEDMDHAHPACSTTTSTYSWTNNLNIFPSCKKCNSTKGGKPLSVWLTKIEAMGLWDSIQIRIFQEWLYSNKSKLIFDTEDTLYVEEQFVSINTFHKIAEYCVKFKKNLSDFVKFQLPCDF